MVASDMYQGKRFELTIAAIIRNEGSYLAEWIEYHGLIGFEHFYLYDNGSTDDTQAILRDYIVQGRVTLLAWPAFPGQTAAYDHALKTFGRDCRWMALIDPDEFIQVEAGETLPSILAALRDVDQVLLPWVHFDSAGHDERPDGLVIESYTRRVEHAHRQPKSLVRPDAVLWAGVHHCTTRHGRTVDPAGHRVAERWILETPPAGPLRLNHYFTKSRAEFAAKLARGQVDGGRGKTMDSFTRFDCPVEDASLASMAPLVREALRTTASRPKQPLVPAAWSAQSELSSSHAWTLRVQATLKDLGASVADAVVGHRAEVDWGQLILRPGTMPPLNAALASFRTDFAQPVCPNVELGSWQSADHNPFGRPYLVLAGHSAEETTVQATMQGRDAGGKPFGAQRALVLPAGDTITFAILSARTMRLDRVLLTATGAIGDVQAEICSFV